MAARDVFTAIRSEGVALGNPCGTANTDPRDKSRNLNLCDTNRFLEALCGSSCNIKRARRR